MNLCKISLLVAFSFVYSNQKKVIPNARVQKGSIMLTIHWTKYGGNIVFQRTRVFHFFQQYTKGGLQNLKFYMHQDFTNSHFIKHGFVDYQSVETKRQPYLQFSVLNFISLYSLSFSPPEALIDLPHYYWRLQRQW